MKIYIEHEPEESETAEEIAEKIREAVAPEAIFTAVINIPVGDETVEELRTSHTRIRTPYIVMKA